MRDVTTKIRRTPKKETQGFGTGDVSSRTNLAETALICEAKKHNVSQGSGGGPQWQTCYNWPQRFG